MLIFLPIWNFLTCIVFTISFTQTTHYLPPVCIKHCDNMDIFDILKSSSLDNYYTIFEISRFDFSQNLLHSICKYFCMIQAFFITLLFLSFTLDLVRRIKVQHGHRNSFIFRNTSQKLHLLYPKSYFGALALNFT